MVYWRVLRNDGLRMKRGERKFVISILSVSIVFMLTSRKGINGFKFFRARFGFSDIFYTSGIEMSQHF